MDSKQGENLPVIIAFTGATGAIYGFRLVRSLLEQDVPLIVIATDSARVVVQQETGRSWESWIEELSQQGTMTEYQNRFLGAPVASGSFKVRGMVVVPCSMGSLARIAGGISSSLIERAADVMLKERRRLILVARETPLSRIHLENMLRLTDAGALILPPMPAFYSHPKGIDDLVAHTVERIMDQLGLSSPEAKRWGESGR